MRQDNHTRCTHVVFHSADLDGHCGGALCRMALETQRRPYRLIPANYGDVLTFDEAEPYDTIWFVDFVPNDHERLLQVLREKVPHGEVAIFDHHKTSTDLFGALNQGPFSTVFRFDVTRAGCELVYEYLRSLLSYEPLKEAVQLLGEYDAWRKHENWENTTLPFQMGMRTFPTDPSTDEGMRTWYKFTTTDYNEVPQICQMGSAILRYQRQIDARQMERAFETVFEGLRAIVLIGGGRGSDTFRSVWNQDRHDVAIAISNVRNEFWTVSLYTDKDIDLTPIARKYGGGGHAKACGFQTKDLNSLFPPRS